MDEQEEQEAHQDELAKQLEAQLSAREAEPTPEPPEASPLDVQLPPDAQLQAPNIPEALDKHLANVEKSLPVQQQGVSPDRPLREPLPKRRVETIDGPFQLDEHLDRKLGEVVTSEVPQSSGWRSAESWENPQSEAQPGGPASPGNPTQFHGFDPDEMRGASEAEFRDADRQRWTALLDHVEQLTSLATENRRRIEDMTRMMERQRL